MPGKFTISCLQTKPKGDFETAIEEALRLAEKSLDHNPAIICLPEYCGGLKSKNGKFYPPHFDEDHHPFLQEFKNFSKKNNIWVSIGSIAITSNNKKFLNRSLLLNGKGEIKYRYDKIHLFDIDLGDNTNSFLESSTVKPGNETAIVKTPFGIIGFSVCYDLRFAQLYRNLSQNGAEILLVPSAFTKITGEAHWHVLNRARAIENGAFVISTCATGPIDGGGETFGHSLIINPWGKVIADGGKDSGIISAEIDIRKVEETRNRIPSLRHDRNFKLKVIDVTKDN